MPISSRPKNARNNCMSRGVPWNSSMYMPDVRLRSWAAADLPHAIGSGALHYAGKIGPFSRYCGQPFGGLSRAYAANGPQIFSLLRLVLRVYDWFMILPHSLRRTSKTCPAIYWGEKSASGSRHSRPGLMAAWMVVIQRELTLLFFRPSTILDREYQTSRE